MSGTNEKMTPNHPDWEQIANSPQFQLLMKKKKRFIIISTIFFVIYYFSLPILAGYTSFLNTPVTGAINGIYLFALSQFFMAWVLAILYVRHANKTDQLVKELVEQQRRKAS